MTHAAAPALPAIHLCIVQPLGYVHSLGFLDQARFMRYQFRRMGAEVSLGKNRLRHDAVNIVFGAHLGFDAALAERASCIFVNLEQLGAGGAQVSPDYLKLLACSAVVDYDRANLAAYTAHPDDVPLISFGYAPYLDAPGALPLAERPIDLLFFGSVNDRRERLFAEIEAAGVAVTTFNGPLYGPERDAVIRQAKAVFNCHYYDSARFEQARAFQCLSLGTPVISERGASAQVPKAFEASVSWVGEAGLREFFAGPFKTGDFLATAAQQLEQFRHHDGVADYADVLAFAAGYDRVRRMHRSAAPWRPTRLHIGSGKDYRPGWLNIDIQAATEPDAVLDLSQPQAWPMTLDTPTHGPVELHEGSLETIYANNVLEHVGDLPRLMTHCLALLAEGGSMLIEVPYEHAPTAWQDPTHVRAMNENSWLYYTDWFWYLGWMDHRFKLAGLTYLDGRLAGCDRAQAHFMRLKLTKCATTPAERMVARTMRPDFGGVPDDDIWSSDDAAFDAAPGAIAEPPAADVAQNMMAGTPA